MTAGGTSALIDSLHRDYERATDGHLVIGGRPVVGCNGTEADGRQRGFWHLLLGGTRVLTPRRAQVVTDALHALELASQGDARSLAWHERRQHKGRMQRLIVTTCEFDVVAVLQPTISTYLLVTAYPVTGAGARSTWRRRAAAALGEEVMPE